jgi:hypothetical protein
MRERLAKFGLTLHPDKTRLIEFGRFAEENRRARGRAARLVPTATGDYIQHQVLRGQKFVVADLSVSASRAERSFSIGYEVRTS